MDPVVHFEIPAKDAKRASAFYQKAFGWSFNQYPGFEYWSAGTTMSDETGRPTSLGSINGGLGLKGKTAPNAPTITIQVASIDEALQNIKKLGGKQVGEKSQVGDMGWAAYFEDSEGNHMGLWQNTQK